MVGFILLAGIVIIAGGYLWSRRGHAPSESLLASERGRRRLGATAVAVYLVLLAFTLAWPEALASFFLTSAIVVLFFASQLFWFRQFAPWGQKLISNADLRKRLGTWAVVGYILLFILNLPLIGRGSEATQLSLKAILLEAPFRWWILCSFVGFLIVALLRIPYITWSAARGLAARIFGPGRPSPVLGRRQFLEKTAVALGAAPFVAGAYGMFYGRLNLETTQRRITLRRLPKAFEGFRLAQLSDIHIGPFMTAEEIRKYVAIANGLNADLLVLTGDYITWDPGTQEGVVQELASLKAPFGVFGSLGNHELWTDTEVSISRLFAERGIRILRQACAPIAHQGEKLNLMGIDYQSVRFARGHGGHLVPKYLAGAEHLASPDHVNILLSHNPNTFDRAAQLGIDLSLAGHTHGGQVTLEFIHPTLSPSRLVTDYVQGWFEKKGAQLYVNRGIGTIGFPIRFGARPEITLFELVRD